MHLVALHFWAALVQYSRTKANKSNDMSQSPTCSPASKFLDEKLTPWVANQPVVLLHLKLVHIPSASCTAWFFKNWSNASTICFKFQWLSLIESEQVLATQPQRNHGRSQQGEQRGSQLHPFGAQKWVADEQQKPMDRNEKNNITCLGMSWFGRFWVPSATVKDARLVVAPRLTVHRDNHWALTAEEWKTWKTWTGTRQNWYLAGTLHTFQDLFRPNAWRKCVCRTKAPSQPNAVAANQVFSKMQNSQKLTIAAQ